MEAGAWSVVEADFRKLTKELRKESSAGS
jgi:hypothetical protein